MSKFTKDLERGKAGEVLFLTHFPQYEALNGYESDFRNKETGDLAELKTDYYDMDKTPNFFIELWSDINTKRLGGPRQAKKHGSKYFYYLYIKNMVIFEFDIEALCKFIDENEINYDFHYIPNEGWATTGILVPREDLKHLAKEIKL